jgi:hypothetical protein
MRLSKQDHKPQNLKTSKSMMTRAQQNRKGDLIPFRERTKHVFVVSLVNARNNKHAFILNVQNNKHVFVVSLVHARNMRLL